MGSEIILFTDTAVASAIWISFIMVFLLLELVGIVTYYAGRRNILVSLFFRAITFMFSIIFILPLIFSLFGE